MRPSMKARATFPAGALLLAGALWACVDRDDRETASIEVERGTAPITMADLGDPNFLFLLDQANAADSAAAAYAFPKATDPRVKQYAQTMMADHHALRNKAHDLAADLRIALEPPPIDPIEPLARREMQLLENTEPGPDFDRAYLRQDIAVHQAVLDFAEQAQQSSDGPEVRALFQAAIPVLFKHLRRAREIEKQLGATA